MPLWSPRLQSPTSNGATPNTPPAHTDIHRPLPPLPPAVIDLDVPTLYPHRRTDPEAPSAKHGRSFSHPFPSFFGGGSRRSGKRDTLKNRINVDSSDDEESIGDGRSNHSSIAPSRNPSVNATSEPMTGRCMTCDSTVRWPRDLKVFRCTVCLTVNDLETGTVQTPVGKEQNTGHALFALPRKRMFRQGGNPRYMDTRLMESSCSLVS